MKKLFLTCLILITGILLFAQTPTWLWAVRAGGWSYDFLKSMAADSLGNQYIAGNFYATTFFGADSLTANENVSDIFVAKLDAGGNWLWARQASGNGTINDMSCDRAGNCYITGSFVDSVSFGNISLFSDGEYDIFVAKISYNGIWQWARKAVGQFDAVENGITSSAEGGCCITGTFSITASFGTNTITSTGCLDVFVARLDAAGNWLWSVKGGGANNDWGIAITTSPDGDFIILGTFTSTADFGNHTLTGNYDIFVAKLSSNGSWLWASQTQNYQGMLEYGGDVGVNSAGQVFVVGNFTEEMTIGTTTLSGSEQYSMFIAGLDALGNWLWARQNTGENSSCWPTSIASDNQNELYITGNLSGSVSFGDNFLTGSADVFVVKINTNGNWGWAVMANGWWYDYGEGITADSAGSVYVAGHYDLNVMPVIADGQPTRDITFGPFNLPGMGGTDIFVAKLEQETGIEDDTAPSVSSLSRLYDAYPNPCNTGRAVTLKASVAKGESGTLSIFNLKGQRVADYLLCSGEHQISFDGKDLASGVYLYRMQTQSVNTVKKLVLLK